MHNIRIPCTAYPMHFISMFLKICMCIFARKKREKIKHKTTKTNEEKKHRTVLRSHISTGNLSKKKGTKETTPSGQVL